MEYIKLYRMADVTVGAKLELDATDANNSMKSFKQQVKEAEKDLISIADKFGATSTQAQMAAKRVAELRDKIGDAKSLADAFNPDQKFRALSQSLTGVLGGFTAITGAMGLLGVESQEVQKQLLKVQSAMALSQGLNQIGESIQSFKNLGSVILNTLGKGGIIGVAIAGVALLTTAIYALVEAQNDELDTAKEVEKVTKKQYETSLKVIDGLDLQERKLRALGKTELEIIEIRRRATRAALIAADAELRALLEVSKATQAQFDKQNESFKKSGARGAGGAALINLLFGVSKKDIKDQKDNISELETAIQGFGVTLLELDVKEKEFFKRREEGRNKPKDEKLINKSDILGDAEVIAHQEKNDLFLQSTIRTNEALNLSDFERTQSEAEQAASRARIAEEEANGKLATAHFVADTLEVLSGLAGKQTAAGKVLAIASATINTYLAAAKALAGNYEVYGPAAPFVRIATVVSTIALGLKQVKEIIKVQVPGGGSGSVPSQSSFSSTASPVQLQPQFTNTRLDRDQLNQIGNATSRSFILEADIQNNRERIVRLNRAARI
jgi:hypothetical protein